MSRLKKFFVMLLLTGFALSTACTQKGTNGPIKIGLLTNTVSQSEDEYRAAEQLSKEFPGQVIQLTIPDNFMQEQETTISNLVSLGSDPDVKAVIIAQAVPGCIAGVRKLRQTRPDILVIFWQPYEDPIQVSKTADLIIDFDNMSRGDSIPELAKKLGATRILHYSFPRHMSIKTLADRRDLMIQASKRLGLEFEFITAPDPLGEGGIPAAQQFILEDVPRQIAKYGKNTAFFCTNDAMTEPMIKTVTEGGAIFVEPDTPSPTIGFPGAYGIQIPADKAGDFAYINEQNKAAVKRLGDEGRIATWPVPASIVSIKSVAKLLLDTKADKSKLNDVETLKAYMAKQAGVDVKLSLYPDTTNYYRLLLDDILY